MEFPYTLKQAAVKLGGHVSGGEVLCPGPGHSAKDRSLAVKPIAANGGFVVHSHSGDDPIVCRDYVREKLGLPKFTPSAPKAVSDDVITRAVMMAASNHKPISEPIATYHYTERDGMLIYDVLRYCNPKRFAHRLADGTFKGSKRCVIYRWPELIRFADATVFICEGEKDADRVASLDLVATTVASGKWTDDCVNALAGRDCWILEDNDDTGREKALEAAKLLHPVANSVKIIRLPGLAEGGDISDWLDAGHTKADLQDACYSTPDWEPVSSPSSSASTTNSPSSPNPETKPKPSILLHHRPHRDRTIHDWDDPDWSLLDTQRGSLPDFPLQVLSPKLQEVIERTSKGAGVTHAHVAVPLIGITSGLIGYSRRLRATVSWIQPATCWTALVGYSGTGKTPWASP